MNQKEFSSWQQWFLDMLIMIHKNEELWPLQIQQTNEHTNSHKHTDIQVEASMQWKTNNKHGFNAKID